MEQFIIDGNQVFNGKVKISGAKNAALPIFFAAILGTNDITLTNVPNLTDIHVACDIFKHLGATVIHDQEQKTVLIKPQAINNFNVPYELAKKMRASIWALAPLVARFGHGEVALPGGCAIGARPVDMHLQALKNLGVHIEFKEGNIVATAPNGLVGGYIFFDKVSVGATATAITAAVLAQGETHIENAAIEPEMVDLCNFLVSIGAQIKGIGTRNLIVTGVQSLGGVANYAIIPDRIECGSFLVSAVVSRSTVTCTNANASHLESVIAKLREAGATITVEGSCITCSMAGDRAKAVNITTAPYPGIPTDIQAQFTLLNCLASGHSIITETIFENRFMHVPELMRMGADIVQKGNTIYISGVEQFSGAEVKATDLRASIALVFAGCVSQGTTIIDQIYHIDRGYENIEQQLAGLGCHIKRVPVICEEV